MNENNVLIFDIMGRNAHFRKFYTNSSSLSYLVPPRSVIAGLIAGMLGLPSERFTNEKVKTYYDKLNSENALITVSLKTPIRKMMQSINYYNLEFKNNSLRYQVPLEILNAQNEDEIRYRVYFSFINDEYNEKYRDKIQLIKKNKFVYPPYLGITEFLASIKFIDDGEISIESNPPEINSICKLDYIQDLDFTKKESKYLTEKMPTGFSNSRTPLTPSDYLIEVNGKPIYAKLKETSLFYKVDYFEEQENVTEYISPM